MSVQFLQVEMSYVFNMLMYNVHLINRFTPYDLQVAGMVCHYIMTRGKHPYAPLDHELQTRVVNGQPDLSSIEHDFEAYDLIKCMLADDPKTRPPAEQLRR